MKNLQKCVLMTVLMLLISLGAGAQKFHEGTYYTMAYPSWESKKYPLTFSHGKFTARRPYNFPVMNDNSGWTLSAVAFYNGFAPETMDVYGTYSVYQPGILKLTITGNNRFKESYLQKNYYTVYYFRYDDNCIKIPDPLEDKIAYYFLDKPEKTTTTTTTTTTTKKTAKSTPVTEKALSATGEECGHGYVDLGLSVKWATCNIGATNPNMYGDYFAWGETTPKDTYTWSNHKYCCDSDGERLTKYKNTCEYGALFVKTTLYPSDDAAHVNWGGSWRMPTDAEFTELRTKCTWTWAIYNGVNGFKVTSRKNGNSIFLPAAGYHSRSSITSEGSQGCYWTSSLYMEKLGCAYYVCFGSSGASRNDYYFYEGHSVRPVFK